MFKQIDDMMADYHNFASYPCYLNVRTLITAAKEKQLLLPPRVKPAGITAQDIVGVLNQQWLSMSNTSAHCIAINKFPKAKTGYTLVHHKRHYTKNVCSILVQGIKPILANYYAYYGGSATNHVYFALSRNRFIDSLRPAKNLLPLKEVCGKYARPLRSMDVSKWSPLQSALNQSDVNRVADEIREKWWTFNYPTLVCRHLTQWKADGWKDAIEQAYKPKVY